MPDPGMGPRLLCFTTSTGRRNPGGGDLSGGDAIPSTMLFLICLLAWAGLEVWRAGWV